MIITRLMGGLGNQMFQYAAGLVLSKKLDTELYIDLSFLTDGSVRNNFTFRNYELDCFTITGKVIDHERLLEFNKKRRIYERFYLHILNKIVFKNALPVPKKYVFYGFSFDKNIVRMSDNSLLEGYWQSEQYFSDVTELLFQEFTFKSKPDEKNTEILREINDSEAVAVHVRRGDYSSNADVLNMHGLCSKEYYINSICQLGEEVSKPKFFFFSDDMMWVKKTFSTLKCEYDIRFVENNLDKNAFEDLRLMSSCKHNIIANSTFSWWGAWLNKNKNKNVCYPESWFADGREEKHIIPPSWDRNSKK